MLFGFAVYGWLFGFVGACLLCFVVIACFVLEFWIVVNARGWLCVGMIGGVLVGAGRMFCVAIVVVFALLFCCLCLCMRMGWLSGNCFGLWVGSCWLFVFVLELMLLCIGSFWLCLWGVFRCAVLVLVCCLGLSVGCAAWRLCRLVGARLLVWVDCCLMLDWCVNSVVFVL